jgi:hypothetical protein
MSKVGRHKVASITNIDGCGLGRISRPDAGESMCSRLRQEGQNKPQLTAKPDKELQ